MKYYGLVDIENLGYGFVEENDNRITDKFIEVTDEYYQQLIDKQGLELQIVSDNKTVFLAKPNLYFVNAQGLWEKKTNEQYKVEQVQKEKERIQELFMTRSDFFDCTIRAWKLREKELLVLIENLLATLPVDEVDKLVAINNFENAQNFYRKHTLFSMIVIAPLKLSETTQVIITDEHLDKLFDEVDKGNKETAWQYLPQPTAIPVKEVE